MPPQIKHDINRSGWESTDFPSVCESCLPENPYVQMLKEDYGAECKICTRPFTVFRWKADRTARTKRTTVCLTCARLKNCCQCCMLDLSFGLPIVIRDAALKLVAPGPTSGVNREYYAQEHEKEIEEGGGGVEEYEKTDEKARDLLRKLANSAPYSRRPRMIEGDEESTEPSTEPQRRIGPYRTYDSRGRGHGGSGGRGGRGGGPRTQRGPLGTADNMPGPQDIVPPEDRSITSLFVTGIEEDLPEYAVREFFTPFGQIKSLVCSHRSHCAFINYSNRAAAEAAAESCQGKAIIAGCPLRVRWGRPRPVGTMDPEERARLAREGRAVVGPTRERAGQKAIENQKATMDNLTVAAPPGADDVKYASLAGE